MLDPSWAKEFHLWLVRHRTAVLFTWIALIVAGGLTGVAGVIAWLTGQPEYISLSTTELRNGGLLYVIGVAPRTEAGTYDNAFKKVRQNIQVSDR